MVVTIKNLYSPVNNYFWTTNYFKMTFQFVSIGYNSVLEPQLKWLDTLRDTPALKNPKSCESRF